MNRQRWTFAAVMLSIIALSAGISPSPARAEHDSYRDEVGLYYDELSPYGDWVDDTEYGYAWCPRNVGSGWRPYSDGRWVDSDYGWTWASDEPFGWATYHYGRWALDSRYGWIWIPGTVWAPAWVSWQSGGGYVGWAPLPPTVGFDFNVGIRLGGLSLAVVIQPRDYIFVSERGFLEPRVGRYAVPRTRNQDLWRRARNVTNYTVINNRVINRGVEVNVIERATRRPVPRYRVSEVNSRGSAGVSRDQLRIYRPPTAKLRSIDIAVRNDAGVRPGPRRGREGRTPDVRPNDRTRRPDVRPRGPERQNQVAPQPNRPRQGTRPAEPERRRTQVEPRSNRPNDRPVTKPVERPRRPPVAEGRPIRPSQPPQVNTPRQGGNQRPQVNRPQPRNQNKPNARPQKPREQRPSGKPNRPNGGGGGGGNGEGAEPKPDGGG